jgi:DNA mismatch repair protein MutS
MVNPTIFVKQNHIMSKGKDKITPLMQQYNRMKQKHPDAILLFRVGDFYETFGVDAEKASEILGIILTSRNNGGSDVPLAGFPHHSLDTYLPKLVKAGYRVAICEQLEKPSPQKKIVKRGVTEIITPGVTLDDRILNHKQNNFLASIYIENKEKFGISFFDISTGEFLTSEGDFYFIEKLIQAFLPAEIIYSKSNKRVIEDLINDKFYTYPLDEWIFTLDYTREKLIEHFKVLNLKGFGIEDMPNSQIASGAILHYLDATENKNLQHLSGISRIQPDHFLWMDNFTIQNLEIIQSLHPNGVPLAKIIDKTITPMGARLLRKWLIMPLKDKDKIEDRLEVVNILTKEESMRTHLVDLFKKIGDMERLISKVPMNKINPRELYHLGKSLNLIGPFSQILVHSGNTQLKDLSESIHPCEGLKNKIMQTLIEDPPVNLSKGDIIKKGVSEELDYWRELINNNKYLLEKIRDDAANSTGISNLKIGFNNVFGYYLEVTNKSKDKVPPEWVRKQTLTGGERYITDELKDLEEKILSAEGEITVLENKIFEDLVNYAKSFIHLIQHNSSIIAQVDVMLSFAIVSDLYHYVKPTIVEETKLDIQAGRHPVIEHQLPIGKDYVPNDIYLDTSSQQILMITGPNMSGKSAILRQTALICILSHIGCFVPALSAEIGIIDKIFSRVGASDNISSGESTFMVEMNETASIMNNLSERSLILLDEIGRGTSTYDGISIAWSIVEYLHNNSKANPKTLFATHYHELNEMAKSMPRVQNFHVSTLETQHKVVFLRKLKEGGSHHSFGIHVAKMAGMPLVILQRASDILLELEKKSLSPQNEENLSNKVQPQIPIQMNIFESSDPTAEALKNIIEQININNMTPVECMIKLNELKQIIEKENE